LDRNFQNESNINTKVAMTTSSGNTTKPPVKFDSSKRKKKIIFIIKILETKIKTRL
jgi:hypothetical protein